MEKIPPKERFSKHAKAKEIPKSLISAALSAFDHDPANTPTKLLSSGFMNANFSVDGTNGPVLMRIYSTDMETAERIVPSKKKTRTTLYLDAKNYKQFKRLCDEKGTTVSEVVNAILVDVLEHYK